MPTSLWHSNTGDRGPRNSFHIGFLVHKKVTLLRRRIITSWHTIHLKYCLAQLTGLARHRAVCTRLRVLSHLSSSETSRCFPFGSIHVHISRPNNCSPLWKKTTEKGTPGRGGLVSVPFKRRSGSFTVKTQPTQQPEQIAPICSAWPQAPYLHNIPFNFRSFIMHCGHKTTQGKYGNRFRTNHLFQNKTKRCRCESTFNQSNRPFKIFLLLVLCVAFSKTALYIFP